jgi:hypothetical protein
MAEGGKRDEGGEPGETEKERRDRELIELLNELRVILPGVQVLFAFLLTVPFSNGYQQMSSLERDVYYVAFGCATMATLLLIAPSTYHRIQFRIGDKERLLHTANRQILIGTAFLLLSVSSAVFVITDVIFKTVAASFASAAAALFGISVWYALPLYRRTKELQR